MFRYLLLIAVVVCIFCAGSICAQDVNQRTQSLVASLDKTKYKKKEKGVVKVEVYVDVKNSAAVKDPADYSGVYDTEFGYRLDLHVDASGAATGSGYDSLDQDGARANFTLRDARVQGALLTATKVYDNGQTQNFEAVFVNRTVSAGTNPGTVTDRESVFGLGFIQTSGSWTNRVFLEKR
jgi:hypothetical protein